MLLSIAAFIWYNWWIIYMIGVVLATIVAGMGALLSDIEGASVAITILFIALWPVVLVGIIIFNLFKMPYKLGCKIGNKLQIVPFIRY